VPTMVRTLIQALGGPAVVTRWANAHGPGRIQDDGDTVQAWMLRDRIPWRWRATIRAMAEDRGLNLTGEWEEALALMRERTSSEDNAA
jgi:hypothetical protein